MLTSGGMFFTSLYFYGLLALRQHWPNAPARDRACK